ncbi:MAG: restriction endonuclease subunit S [Methylococcales bacterium]
MSKVTPYVFLKDLCNVNQGLQIPIAKRFKTYAEGRYFYITMQFLKEGHNEKYYVQNPPVSSICNKEDIIVVRTGSTGEVLTGIHGCFHNNFFKVNYNKEKIVGKYLYYCLSTKEKKKEMKTRSGITTIPDLNHFMFLDMKIPLLSYSRQISTVKILDALNTKIELNNRINTELEAIAKTLYDYWFVQFDFPDQDGKPYKSSGGKMVYNETLKREIPEGWNGENVLAVAELLGGGTPSKKKEEYWNGEIPFFTPTDADLNVFKLSTDEFITSIGLKNCSSPLFEKGDIFITARGSVGKLMIAANNMAMNQSCYALKAKEQVSYSYLYYLAKELIHYLKVKSSGSVFNSIVSNDIKHTILVIPSPKIINDFSGKVEPAFERILLNTKENQQLTKLRDWLLPMLMNGQVTVK